MLNYKKYLTSLSFRINLTLLIVMVVLGWGFARSVMFIIGVVGNAERCVTTSSAITHTIDGRLMRVENTVKAGAIASHAKLLTVSNSKSFCDSIRSISGVDSVYLSLHGAHSKEMRKSFLEVCNKGISTWSEPHTYNNGKTVVTFLTPLTTRHGKQYGVLCADLPIGWLQKLSENEKRSDNAIVTIASRKGTYLYHPEGIETTTNDSALASVLDEYGAYVFERDDHRIVFKDRRTNTCDSVASSGWVVRCSAPINDRNDITFIIVAATYTLMAILFGLMALSIIFTLRWQLHPLSLIADATDAVAKGQFDVELPYVKGHTDIRRLRDSVKQMQVAIKQYIQDLRHTTEQKVSIERDIAIAANIQQGMLPKPLAERADIDIHGMLHPAKMVGGDLFDYFIRKVYTEDDGNHDTLFFCIGDVSGKGVPAALIMSVVCHLFRNISRRSANAARICDSINIGLAESNEENMFCTLFVGVLDLKTGRLDYCNAGHNAPVFVRRGEAKFMSPKVNLPLGVDGKFRYKAQYIHLKQDDMMFLYTDGVTEAENKDKQLFGDDATLKAVASACKATSMQVLVANVFAAVKSFVESYEQSDDITVLSLRFTKSPSRPPRKER